MTFAEDRIQYETFNHARTNDISISDKTKIIEEEIKQLENDIRLLKSLDNE